MSELDKFAENFARRLEGYKQAQLRFAVCKSVDWEEKTMTATGVSDDVDYEGVQIGFGFADIKPAVGSTCLIGILEGKEALTFLINAEKVEVVEVNVDTEIKINGGKNDGLVKIGKLEQNLDSIKTYLDVLNTTIATGLSATAAPGSAGAASGFTASMQSVPLNFVNMENEKITH